MGMVEQDPARQQAPLTATTAAPMIAAPPALLNSSDPAVRRALQRRLLQRKQAQLQGERVSDQDQERVSEDRSDSASQHGARKGTGPQKSADLDALYQEAAGVHAPLTSLAQGLAQACQGQALVPGLKGRERAEAKVAADYGGDASHLTDIARASVVFQSLSDVQRAAKEVPGRVKVHRVKDRFANPAGGYRDMLYNVDIQGHICELQLQLEAIQKVKSGAGHKIYEKVRHIEDQAKLQNRKPTAEEAQELMALRSEMEGKYDEAFAAAQGGQ